MSRRAYGFEPTPPTSRELIREYVERACSPILLEPNLGLNMEIADYVNTKKANTPREAAVEVLRMVNQRKVHVSMLALTLLDILVKNCGYPFHLQLGTKEFLNGLVRRFPEHPPAFPPPPMVRILELIHEWKNTLCVTSRHKEDLVHIRDMHRLLTYKGYRFPDLNRQAASVLNATNPLRTPEEMEEEDRNAQAAKLQELIRRGRPRDLEQAQKLMKIMAGAETSSKPDYAKKARLELDAIKQRVNLLNEMLTNVKDTDAFTDGDAFDQIASSVRSVQSKIQSVISAPSTPPETVETLLGINDLVNHVLARYDSFRRGDRSVPETGASNLIDIDDDATAVDSPISPGSTHVQGSNDLLGDLAGLSLGPVALGGANNDAFGLSTAQKSAPVPTSAPTSAPLNKNDLLSLYSVSSNTAPSSAAPASAAATPVSTSSVATPSNGTQSHLSQLDPDLFTAKPTSAVPTPATSVPAAPAQPKPKDIFEDLLS